MTCYLKIQNYDTCQNQEYEFTLTGLRIICG